MQSQTKCMVAAIGALVLGCAANPDDASTSSGAADTWRTASSQQTVGTFGVGAADVVLTCTESDGTYAFVAAGDEERLTPEERSIVHLLTLSSASFPDGLPNPLFAAEDSQPVLVGREDTSGGIALAPLGLERCLSAIDIAFSDEEYQAEFGNAAEVGPRLALLDSLISRGARPAIAGGSVSLLVTAQSSCQTARTIIVSAGDRHSVFNTPGHAPCRYDHAHVQITIRPGTSECGAGELPTTLKKAAVICYPKRCRIQNIATANPEIEGTRGTDCAPAPAFSGAYLPYTTTGVGTTRTGGPIAANGDVIFSYNGTEYSTLTDDRYSWTQIAGHIREPSAAAAMAFVNGRLQLSAARMTSPTVCPYLIRECSIATRE